MFVVFYRILIYHVNIYTCSVNMCVHIYLRLGNVLGDETGYRVYIHIIIYIYMLCIYLCTHIYVGLGYVLSDEIGYCIRIY